MFELVIPAVNRHVFSRLFGDRREMISFGAQPPDDELFIRVLSPFFEPKRAMRIVPAAAGRPLSLDRLMEKRTVAISLARFTTGDQGIICHLRLFPL